MKSSPAFSRRVAPRERASVALLALLMVLGTSPRDALGQALAQERQANDVERAVRPSAVHAPPRGAAGIPTDAEGSPLDPVAVLQQQIAAGEAVLEFDDQFGYLPALLEALDIPVSSQGLVFSRTSLQTNLIAPWAPRALYFNDDVYIGYVQESSFIEIASVDPDDGGVFYTLPQDESGPPKFVREGTTCLMCHDSKTVTGGVPGFIVRSVLVDRLGYPITPLQSSTVTDRTPFDERLGGFYVTGTHENAVHSGNTMAPVLSHEVANPDRYLNEFDMTTDGNVTSLEGRFDVEPYPTPHSDIVALMVLTHQTQVHNLITMAHAVAQEASVDLDVVRRLAVPGAPEPKVAPATQVKINGAVQRLVRGMLFSREAPLAGKVTGTSGFTEEFEALGPRDGQGRSFRDFDLETRLFRYPMSFLIYSPAFVTLPDIVKKPFYERVADVLEGRDTSNDFSHLSQADRTAIREILVETKPEFLTFTQSNAAR